MQESSHTDWWAFKAFMHNPAGMTLTNGATGRFIAANQAFLDLTGFWRAHVIGATSEELGLWPERARRSEIGASLGELGQVGPLLGSLRHRTGRLISCAFVFKLLHDEQDRFSVLTTIVPRSWFDEPVAQ